MSEVANRAQVEAILGSVDEQTIADVIATGATPAQIAEAHAWVASDEALLNEGRPMPSGPVAALVEILKADEELDDAPGGL